MSQDKPVLVEWLLANAPDCQDNSCMFGGRGKGGMRTNGGCRCFKDLPNMKRIYVERLYRALFPANASGPASGSPDGKLDMLKELKKRIKSDESEG